jgi:hypothetical protein
MRACRSAAGTQVTTPLALDHEIDDRRLCLPIGESPATQSPARSEEDLARADRLLPGIAVKQGQEPVL